MEKIALILIYNIFVTKFFFSSGINILNGLGRLTANQHIFKSGLIYQNRSKNSKFSFNYKKIKLHQPNKSYWSKMFGGPEKSLTIKWVYLTK